MKRCVFALMLVVWLSACHSWVPLGPLDDGLEAQSAMKFEAREELRLYQRDGRVVEGKLVELITDTVSVGSGPERVPTARPTWIEGGAGLLQRNAYRVDVAHLLVMDQGGESGCRRCSSPPDSASVPRRAPDLGETLRTAGASLPGRVPRERRQPVGFGWRSAKALSISAVIKVVARGQQG